MKEKKKEKKKKRQRSSVSKFDLWKFLITTILSIIFTWVTVSYGITQQMKKGKYLALDIASLYCMNLVNNGIDIENKSFKYLDTDKEKYLRLLKKIEDQLISLKSNPYYASLFSEFVNLQFYASNEISILENSDSLKTTKECHLQFINLYFKVRKESPKLILSDKKTMEKFDSDFSILRHFFEKQNE